MIMKDAEDWSNGCWNFSFAIPGIHSKYRGKVILNDDNISQYYCFHYNFDETKADLVSVWD